MSAPDPILVFVYNADSGLFEAMTDAIRKVVAPMTQSCNLCALTYQVAWMKPDWSSFVNHLGVAVEFLHKDEFKEKYPNEDARFPSAYIDRGGGLELFVSVEEMNSAKTLEELIEIVKRKLKDKGIGKPAPEAG
jgi:hypothetical protein